MTSPPHEHTHLRPLTWDEVRRFPDDGYRYELVDPDDQRLLDPPVLAVEVLSPSTRYRDVGLELRAYEDAGLGRYWVVDPAEPRLTVHRLVEGRSVPQASVAGDERYVAEAPFPVEVTPSALVG